MKIEVVRSKTNAVMYCLLLFVFSFFSGIDCKAGELPPNNPTIHPSNANFCFPGGYLYVDGYNGTPTFIWYKLGDPTFSSPNNDSLLATSNGVYSCVIISGNNRDSLSIRVRINPLPQANFSFFPNGGCGRIKVNFLDLSTPSDVIQFWNWNFGDGGSSSLQNPSHTFRPPPGNGFYRFYITLTVTDSNGCVSTKRDSVEIGRGPDATLTDPYGDPPFSLCQGSGQLMVVNQSQTISTNTSYKIFWGDNSDTAMNNTFDTAYHSYISQGYFNLLFVAYSSSGCTDTSVYRVFIGSNPAIPFTNPGQSKDMCLPFTLIIPRDTSIYNTPGTEFIISSNDGTPSETIVAPLTTRFFSHTFTRGSCGVINNVTGINNSFYVKIIAKNGCDTTGSFLYIGPITTITRPDANFIPYVACQGNTSLFHNISKNGVKGSNCDSVNQISWSILNGVQGTDYNITSGSVNQFINSSQDLGVVFINPGTYSIRLIIKLQNYNLQNTANDFCYTDTIVKTICISPAPVATFSIGGLSPSQPSDTGCAPFSVVLNGSSTAGVCGAGSFGWSISYLPALGCLPDTPRYEYVNSTDSTVDTPRITFYNPGTYTISLQTAAPGGGCVSNIVSKQVVVKAPPRVWLNILPDSLCSNNSSISPSIRDSCFVDAATFLWTVSPSFTSTLQTPPPFQLPVGIDTVKIKVTNVCGSVDATKIIVVTQRPSDTISYPNGGNYCKSDSVVKNVIHSSYSVGSYFVSPLTGLSLNMVNGSINPYLSNPGTYIVTYSIPARGGCSPYSTNDTVIITAPFYDSIYYSSNFCNTINIPQNVIRTTSSGTFHSIPLNGLSIDSLTGYVLPSSSIPGSYTVTYTLPPAGGCNAFSAQTNLIIHPQPTINGPDSVCQGSSISLSGSPTPNATSPWASLNTNIATVNASGVVSAIRSNITGVSIANIVYQNANTCRDTFVIRVNPLPVISGNNRVCIGDSIRLSATTRPASNNPWFSPNPAVATVNDSGWVKGVSFGSVRIRYTNIHNCDSIIAIQVDSLPVISGAATNPTNCSSSTGYITLSGLVPSTAYALYYNNSGPRNITSTASGTYIISNLTSGSYSNIYVTAGPASCRSNTLSLSLSDPGGPDTPVVSIDTIKLCSGQNAILSVSSPDPAVTYTWTGPAFPAAGQSGSSVTITSAATTASGLYFVTAKNTQLCRSLPDSVYLLVSQTPSAPVVASVSYCQYEAAVPLLVIPASGDTLNWFDSNNNPLGSAPIPQTQIPGTTTFYVSQTNVISGCKSGNATIRVTVKPKPDISGYGISPISCATATGSIVIKGLTTDSVYTVRFDTTGVTVIRNNQTAVGDSIIVSGLPDNMYTNIFVLLRGCPSDTIGPIELNDPNPPAAPVASADTALCKDLNVTLSVIQPLSGVTYTWYGPGLTPTAGNTLPLTNVQLANAGMYYVYATRSGCKSDNDSALLTVYDRPAAPLVSSPVVYCQFAPTAALTADTNPAGSGNSILWYTSATGGTGTDQPPPLTSANSGTTTYYVSQINNKQCEGSRVPINVIINPTPRVTGRDTTICSSGSFNLIFSGSGIQSNTKYYWSAPVVTGGLTGGISDTNAISVSGTLSNPDTLAHTALYTITPITDTCKGLPFIVRITVNPAPRVRFSLPNDTICSGGNTQSIAITSPTPGVSIPWVCNVPPGISNLNITSGNDNIPSQAPVNNTSAPITIEFKALAIVTGLSSCPGDTSRYYVTVNPKPRIPDTSLSVCSGETFSFNPINNAPYIILPANTSYTWTVTGNNNVTGSADQPVNTSSIGQSLINLTNTPQTVIYNISPVSLSPGAPDSCRGNTFQLRVIVRPRPSIPTLYDTICSGESFSVAGINGIPNSAVIVPGNTQYSWDLPNTSGTNIYGSGISAQSNLDSVKGQLFNSGNAPANITYTTIATAAGCADTLDVIVRVNPLTGISNPPQSVCNGNSTLAVNWESGLDPSIQVNYSWQLISAGVVTGAAASGSGATLPAMTLTNNSVSQDTVKYLVTSTASACPGPPAAYNILVNPDAKADFNNTADTACWPFLLPIQNNSPQTADSGYRWYANGVLIGSGYAFPGYTIPVSDTFIDIKLIVLSRYGCLDDSMDHRFYTKNKPRPNFSLQYNPLACAPLHVFFTNNTQPVAPALISPFNYHWDFGNGQTSNLASPPNSQVYTGSLRFVDTIYYITLTASNECESVDYRDSLLIKSPPKALFAPDRSIVCSNDTARFNNSSMGLNNTYYWNFGDNSPGLTVTNGLPVEHIYNVGSNTVFDVQLIATNQCGSDTTAHPITITPNGVLLNFSIANSTNYVCEADTVRFYNVSSGGTRFAWNFGDGSPVYISGSNIENISHIYTAPGLYYITVTGENNCTDTTVIDSVIIIRTPKPDFDISNNNACPGSPVYFINRTDSANSYQWNFGDPASGSANTSAQLSPSHVYSEPGVYTVNLTASLLDVSGIVCSRDTSFLVNVSAPMSAIVAPDSACVGDEVNFTPNVTSMPGLAPIADTLWMINGVPVSAPPSSAPNLSHVFSQPGQYTLSLIVGTAAGCRDTAEHLIVISSLPSLVPGPGQRICQGQSIAITAQSNGTAYQWTPSGSLSCSQCQSPVASPLSTTRYQITVLNDQGCSRTGSVLVTVIPPFTMNVSTGDTICRGESILLSAGGAEQYTWSPAASLSCSTCPNPLATPDFTTTYTVVGTDNDNCFPVSQDITVVVGQIPSVTLPSGSLVLAGEIIEIEPTFPNSNDPIRTYSWTPANGLNCSTCMILKDTVRSSICYQLEIETIYGCKASDTMCYLIRCENTQVFIPNAIKITNPEPENNMFTVYGRGIAVVKNLRIYNRWGEIVFEKSNFSPNDPNLGWNGRVRGKEPLPDVYVYTAEVVCDGGLPFTYKGNVTILR